MSHPTSPAGADTDVDPGGPPVSIVGIAGRVRELLERRDRDGAWSTEVVAEALEQLDPLIPPKRLAALAARVRAELVGLGPVDGLLALPGVTDVLVNGPGQVWIERAGHLQRTEVVLDADEVQRLVERTLGPLGRRVDPSAPV
ncbi:MAG: hypothetical protein KDB24_00505, partial [Microthrixaceae bacterium]|nr:hypothetical protein [Microthrixaceae bacterium]